MYCNHCGYKLPLGSRFCNRCGGSIQGKGPQQQVPNIPPPLTHPARRKVRFQNEDEDDEEYYEEPELDEEDDADEVFEDEYEDEEKEKVVFSISPAIYGVAIRYLFAIALSVIATALIALFAETLFSQVSFLMVLGIATVLMMNPIYHHIQHNRTVYTLTSVKLEIQSGVFSKISRNIPLRHIQDVTVNQTLRERLLGVGDVIIDSAVMEGTMPLSSIKDPRKYADLILNELQYWN